MKTKNIIQRLGLFLFAFLLVAPAWGETFTENVSDFSNVSITKSNMGTRTSPDGVLTVIWTNARYYQNISGSIYKIIEMAGGALSSSTARQDGAFARSKLIILLINSIRETSSVLPMPICIRAVATSAAMTHPGRASPSKIRERSQQNSKNTPSNM